MKEKEQFDVNEIKSFKEHQEFKAEEYYQTEDNKKVKEKYDTFEDSSESRKRIDYFDLSSQNKPKKKNNIVKTILKASTSISTGAIALIAGVIVVFNAISNITNNPYINFYVNEIGVDFIDCEVEVGIIEEEYEQSYEDYDYDREYYESNIHNYILRISNPNQTIEYECLTGMNSYLITGLNPYESYTINVINYDTNLGIENILYTYDFYTLTSGISRCSFYFDQDINYEYLSNRLIYKVDILNKNKKGNYYLEVSGDEYSNTFNDIDKNTFSGEIDNLDNGMYYFLVYENDELIGSYEYELHGSFIDFSYEVNYDYNEYNVYLEYSANLYSDRYNYYLTVSSNNYYDFILDEEPSGRIDNLEEGTYYLYIYAYLKEEYINYDEEETEYRNYYEKFLYSSEFTVSIPSEWINSDELNVEISFINQGIILDIYDYNDLISDDDNVLIDVTFYNDSYEETNITDELYFEKNDINYSYYTTKFNYDTSYINIYIYKYQDNNYQSLYEINDLYIDSYYKENEFYIDINESEFIYSDDELVIPYTLGEYTGDYSYDFLVYSNGEEIDITNIDESITINNIYEYEHIEIYYNCYGEFYDGLHDYSSTLLFEFNVPHIGVEVSALFNNANLEIDYLFNTNSSYITILECNFTVSLNGVDLFHNANNLDFNEDYSYVFDDEVNYVSFCGVSCNITYKLNYQNELIKEETIEKIISIPPVIEITNVSFYNVLEDAYIAINFIMNGGYVSISDGVTTEECYDNVYEKSVDVSNDLSFEISYFDYDGEEFKDKEVLNFSKYTIPDIQTGYSNNIITYNDDESINAYSELVDYNIQNVNSEIKLYQGIEELELDSNQNLYYKENINDLDFTINLSLYEDYNDIRYNLLDITLFEYSIDYIQNNITSIISTNMAGANVLKINTDYYLDSSYTLIIDGVENALNYQFNASESEYEIELSGLAIDRNSVCLVRYNVCYDYNNYEELNNSYNLSGNQFKEYEFEVTIQE